MIHTNSIVSTCTEIQSNSFRYFPPARWNFPHLYHQNWTRKSHGKGKKNNKKMKLKKGNTRSVPIELMRRRGHWSFLLQVASLFIPLNFHLTLLLLLLRRSKAREATHPRNSQNCHRHQQIAAAPPSIHERHGPVTDQEGEKKSFSPACRIKRETAAERGWWNLLIFN